MPTSWMTDRDKSRTAHGTRSANASPARRSVTVQERPASASRPSARAGTPGREGTKSGKESAAAVSRRRLPFDPISTTSSIYNPYNSTPCIPNGLLQKGMSANEVSTNAMLRKQVCDLSVKLRHLSAQNGKAVDRLQDLRLDHKRLKCSNSVAERELGICVKSMERLTRENETLKRTVDELQAYTRRLETDRTRASRRGVRSAPLDDAPGTSALDSAAMPTATSSSSSTRESLLKKQLNDANEELALLEGSVSEERRKREAAEHEVAILQRSMKMQIEELSGRDDGDVKSRLLHLLAKGREEGVTLAMQAASSRESYEKALAVNASIQARYDSTAEELVATKAALRESEESTANAEAEALHYRDEGAASRSKLEAAVERYEKCAAELESSRSECARILASREDLARGLEAMEQQMQTKVAEARSQSKTDLDSALRQLAEERQNNSYAVGEASSVISALRFELDTLKGQYDNERRLDGDRIRQESAANDRLSGELRARDAQHRELLNEIDNLHRDIESLQEVNMELSQKLKEATEKGGRERERYSKMAEQIGFLDEQLRQHRQDQSRSKHQLQDRLTTCLEDLSRVVGERDSLKQRLSTAETGMNSLKIKEAATAKECERLRATNEQLGAGAAKTNSSMLEQVSSARAQNDSLMVKIRELETSLSRERGNSERLQSLVESERRTNNALTRQLSSSTSSEVPGASSAPGGSKPGSPAGTAARKSPLNRRLLQEQRDQIRSLDSHLRPRSPNQARVVGPSARIQSAAEGDRPQEVHGSEEHRGLAYHEHHEQQQQRKEEEDGQWAQSPSRQQFVPSASEVIAETEAILGQGGGVHGFTNDFSAPSPPQHFHRMSVPMTDVIDDDDDDNDVSGYGRHDDADVVDENLEGDENESDVSMTLSQLATSDAYM